MSPRCGNWFGDDRRPRQPAVARLARVGRSGRVRGALPERARARRSRPDRVAGAADVTSAQRARRRLRHRTRCRSNCTAGASTWSAADLDDDMLRAGPGEGPRPAAWLHVDLATMQLDRRFGIVAMPGNVMLFCRDVDRRAVVHSCAQHLEPGGLLVAGLQLRPIAQPARVRRVVRRLRADPGRSMVHVGASTRTRAATTPCRCTGAAIGSTCTICSRGASPSRHRDELASDWPVTIRPRSSTLDAHRPSAVRRHPRVDPRAAHRARVAPRPGERVPPSRDRSFEQPLVVVCNRGTARRRNLVAIGFADVPIWWACTPGSSGGPVEPPDHSHLGVTDASPPFTENLLIVG